MKKITLIGLLSLLLVRGTALAQQSEEQKKGASVAGMMQGMMSGETDGGMMGMMKMMAEMGKMMDQCSAMMESTHPASGQTKEGE